MLGFIESLYARSRRRGYPGRNLLDAISRFSVQDVNDMGFDAAPDGAFGGLFAR
jgi:hypothetical protein